jgi:hypothetical protein
VRFHAGDNVAYSRSLAERLSAAGNLRKNRAIDRTDLPFNVLNTSQTKVSKSAN